MRARLKKVVESKTGPLSELYRERDVREVLAKAQDNGICSGVDLVARIVRIYRNYGYKTQVIAASIRNARQVREVAEVGVDIATLPSNVIREMIRHPKTLEGMRRFTEDIVPSYRRLFK